MNILILSPFLPYPLDQGGKIRIFNIIKHLSRSHAVTLAAVVDDRNAADLRPLQELCEEVVLVERPARLWPDRMAFFGGLAPYNVIRYRSDAMRAALDSLRRRRKFDLVQVEFAMMWQYADLFDATPVILDAHNIEHKNVQQIGNSRQNLAWRLMYRLEEKRLRQVEERAWRDCALCFAVSEEERDEIAARTGDDGKVVTAANGVDLERFPFRPRQPAGKKILFLGGMDYAPNLDAATYFLTEVFPLIRRDEPDATLLLVGRELGRLGHASAHPGVEYHESVPEVLPWFYAADVLAVPLRQGAGTRIKVLEAMAAGLPVVSTAKGCEGILAQNGVHLLCGETCDAFAAAVREALTDRPRMEKISRNARGLIEAGYSWHSTVDQMELGYRKAEKG